MSSGFGNNAEPFLRQCLHDTVTDAKQAIALRDARISELEGAWAEIDVALCNAERSAIDRSEEMPRLFYSRLRDRLRKVFVGKQQ